MSPPSFLLWLTLKILDYALLGMKKPTPAQAIKSAGRTARQAPSGWNVHKTQEMYNLTVDTAHTFFVSEGQWLVHNSCRPKKIVIGETMERVKDAAREIGARWYQAWDMDPYDKALSLKRNERWIRTKIKEGYEIIDIGINPTRDLKGLGRSDNYLLELDIIKKFKYPVKKYPFSAYPVKGY